MAGIADLISKTGKTTPSRAPSMAMMMAGKPRNPAADKYLQSKQGSTKTPDLQIMRQRMRQQMAAPQRPMGPQGNVFDRLAGMNQAPPSLNQGLISANRPRPPQPVGPDPQQQLQSMWLSGNNTPPPPQLNWQQRLAQMAGPQGGSYGPPQFRNMRGAPGQGPSQQAVYGASQFNPMMQQPQLNTMQRYMQAGGKGGSGQPAPGKGGAAGGKGGQAPQRGGYSAGPGRYGRVR